MTQPTRTGSILSGALLIAGTSIGAGMLALPFATGIAGFIPALGVNLLCYLFMLCTGLLFLEVTLWMPDGSNLLTMTRRLLGPMGAIVGGAAFIYLYYSLLVAYFTGVAPLISQVLGISEEAALLLFVLLFGGIAYAGTYVADRLNFVLMTGLIVSYFLLVGFGASEVQGHHLLFQKWPLAITAIPTVLAAFGYHNVIPTVTTYLKRDARKLRYAIFIGTCIPLIVYLLWQWMVIGIVPQELLRETLETGQSIAQPIASTVQSHWIVIFARYFAFFAIVTSVIGVSLSMVDFIGDGTKIRRQGKGRFLLCLMVFIPPFILSWAVPNLFFQALHYAGVFGEALLNGIFPILMVFIGRYKWKLKSEFQLPGKAVSLALLLVMICCLIGWEVYKLV